MNNNNNNNNPTLTNPFFTAPIEGYIPPASLYTAVDPVFGTTFHLPNCPGSEIIAQLHAHFQRSLLHVTHTLTSHPVNPFQLTPIFPEPLPSCGALGLIEANATLDSLSHIIPQINVIVGPLPPGVNGRTTNMPHRSFTKFPGCGSTITISTDRINQLHAAVTANNTMLTQYLQFDIARLLLHEFGHALTNAVLPYPAQCYLGTGTTTEMGFELEARLFGGIIDRDLGMTYSLSGDLPFRLVQLEWPNQHIIDLYNGPGATGVGISCKAPVPWAQPRWQVPFGYIQKMFGQSFWLDVSADVLGPRPVQCARERGVLTVLISGNVLRFVDPRDPNVANYVPAGYTLEGNGLLRRTTYETFGPGGPGP